MTLRFLIEVKGCLDGGRRERMPGTFDDLLTRVDKLSSVTASEGGVFGEKPPLPSTTAPDDLNSIFRLSENLFKKKCLTTNTQSILFGDKGLVLHVAPPTLTPAPVTEPATVLEDDEQYEAELEERARLQTERAFFNQTVLANPIPTLKPAARKEDSFRKPTTSQYFPSTNADVSKRELLYGDKVRAYIKLNKRKSLAKLLREAAVEGNASDDLLTAWNYMVAVFGERLPTTEEPARSLELVTRATKVIEQQFVDHMQEIVNRNLDRAERGGVPGTRNLIAAYLKVSGEGGAWEQPYHALRAGDLSAAKESLGSLSHFPQAAMLVKALVELMGKQRMSEETKTKLRSEWRHEQNHVTDPHQRALYAALLGLIPEGASSMEEWLWARLTALRTDPAMPAALYVELQKAVSIELGEAYFMQSGSPSDWFHYFSALALTGQPERAVKVAFDGIGILDAVHLALVAHESRLLQRTAIHDELLKIDATFPTKASLNIVRLVNMYTKGFELTDVPRSLDYWFFLKGVEGPSRGDVFETAISRAVYLTSEDALILGKRQPNGDRTPGLIDDYEVDVPSVIERVAKDTVIGGAPSDAIRLFLLADNLERAVEVSCDRLATCIRHQTDIAAATTEAQSLFFLATSQPGTVSPSSLTCLSQLLDTCSLLHDCAVGRYRDALLKLRKIRLVPTTKEGISASLADFHRLPAKVRDVLPEICFALTKLVGDSIDEANEDEKRELKKLAEALFIYAAAVPHKFPGHVHTKMLEMQSQLS